MNFIDGVIMIEELKAFSIGVDIIFAVIEVLMMAALLWGLHICNKDGLIKALFVVVPALLIGGLTLTAYCYDVLNLKEPTGSYEVVVTDEVDMKVFEDTYEIVSYSDGKYTIKLK